MRQDERYDSRVLLAVLGELARVGHEIFVGLLYGTRKQRVVRDFHLVYCEGIVERRDRYLSESRCERMYAMKSSSKTYIPAIHNPVAECVRVGTPRQGVPP